MQKLTFSLMTPKVRAAYPNLEGRILEHPCP
jgi:hypothetical protein